jgi:hypothetical protein
MTSIRSALGLVACLSLVWIPSSAFPGPAPGSTAPSPAAAASATAPPEAAAGAQAQVVGRWKLVEQRYGGGQANLADTERPVFLELEPGTAGLAGKIWAGDDPREARDWPAYVTDSGALPVEVLNRTEDLACPAVEVHYLVRPVPEEDLVLEITEHYDAADDGKTLVGWMRVTFTGGDRNRGNYVLQRRWERQP